LKQLDEATFLDVFDGVPQAEISRNEIEAGINIVDVLNEKTGFLKSNGEARRALTANSISVNKKSYRRFVLSNKDLINNQFVLLQSGKKNYLCESGLNHQITTRISELSNVPIPRKSCWDFFFCPNPVCSKKNRNLILNQPDPPSHSIVVSSRNEDLSKKGI
jgi:hypothetical protein